MGFDCMIMKERENATEKNDFMIILNYLSTVLINVLVTHALTHMHTHTYTIYDDYIVSENRQNLPEMCLVTSQRL